MDLTAGTSSLPLAAQLPAAAVLLLVLLAALRMADTTSAKFVVFACWLRFMLSAFHAYTYKHIAAGISGNAIGSAFLFMLGLLLLRRQLLLSKAVVGVYAVIASIALSAIANFTIKDSFEPLMKMGLFLVIALHCYEALRGGDERRFALATFLSFSPLVLFQVISLLLGVAKNSEDGGARSFVGGYDHEAPFSVALVALFVVAALSSKVPLRWRIPILPLVLVGIILANYRTAILAIAPLLLYLLVSGFGRLFDSRLRPLVTGVTGAAILVLGAASLVTLERFSDLRTIVQSSEPIIKPVNEFSFDDSRLLSGRTYLWSEYYYHWKDEGTAVQHLVGFGPDSWLRYFTIYAHSTFVDYLFEYGLVGLLALTALFASGFALALRSGPERWKLVAGHLGFLILNLATMPMWLVEGLILYGLLFGFTMYYRAKAAARSRPSRPRSALRPAMT